MPLAVLNPYHPDMHNDAALDTLLVTIGLVILVLIVVGLAHRSRAREDALLAAEQLPPADGARSTDTASTQSN
jgi:hypothetical protein